MEIGGASLIKMRSLLAFSVAAIFFSFPIFPSLVSTATNTTAAYQPLSLSALNVSSLGTDGVPVDPRFGMEVYFTDEPLDQISCIMVAINAMADRALHDWNSRVPFFRSRWLQKYPHVDISVQPEPPATDIDQKVLIWGLDAALYNIIVRVEFVEAYFDLLWSNVKVATMHFRSRAPYLAAPLTLGAGLSNQTSVPRGNATDAATISAYGDIAHFVFLPLDDPNPLDRMSVFTIIMSALRYVAVPSASAVVTEMWRVGPMPGRNVKIEVTGQYGPGLPRRGPPYLEYRYVVEALRAVPEWMLDRDSFKDVSVGIYVRNVLVGVGFVDARDDNGVASAGLLPLDLPNAQASTS